MKDLWALRLQKVQGRIAYESETETEAPSSQVFSSQSESEATTASRSTRRSRHRREKEKVQEDSPKLVETLALCYIGLLFLRLPVTVADIHRWTNDGQLLYYRTAREVPLGMRERLPPRYQARLEPQDLLPPTSLHAEVIGLLNVFTTEFGMSPPVPNVPLIMYRWLKQLMLPIEVYAASNRLARLLETTFDFNLSAKAGNSTMLKYPEARMMATIVVVTKLFFPLDDINRSTGSEADLSATRMDWKAWAKQHGAQKQSESASQALTFEDCFGFDEAGCHSASEDKLDAYLDWYEGNIAAEEIRERGRAGKDADLRRAMFAMFPTHGTSAKDPPAQTTAGGQTSPDNRVRTVQSKLRPRLLRDAQPTEDEDRPVGSFYRRLRDVSELSVVGKVFYERAAELAGLSLEDLVQVALAVEGKMQKLQERLRKEEEA